MHRMKCKHCKAAVGVGRLAAETGFPQVNMRSSVTSILFLLVLFSVTGRRHQGLYVLYARRSASILQARCQPCG